MRAGTWRRRWALRRLQEAGRVLRVQPDIEIHLLLRPQPGAGETGRVPEDGGVQGEIPAAVQDRSEERGPEEQSRIRPGGIIRHRQHDRAGRRDHLCRKFEENRPTVGRKGRKIGRTPASLKNTPLRIDYSDERSEISKGCTNMRTTVS